MQPQQHDKRVNPKQTPMAISMIILILSFFNKSYQSTDDASICGDHRSEKRDCAPKFILGVDLPNGAA